MKRRVLLILAVMFLSASAVFGQQHEVGFTSGGLKVGERGFDLPRPGRLKFSTGFTYQISYAHRLIDAKLASLYFELPLAGTPRTKVEVSNVLSPRSYSSLFFTPGLKLKFLPGIKYSPYLVAGAGLARFNESDTLTNGQSNPDQTSKNDFVFDFGGGIDVRVYHGFGIRGEVRDYYSELPPLNVNALKDRQHNALVSAGFFVRF